MNLIRLTRIVRAKPYLTEPIYINPMAITHATSTRASLLLFIDGQPKGIPIAESTDDLSRCFYAAMLEGDPRAIGI